MSDKKKDLLLVGAGGLGRVALEAAMINYNCFFVDDGIEVGSKVCGFPVIGAISELSALRKDFDFLVVTIGNNKIREDIYNSAIELKYSFPNIIFSSAYISPFAKIGEGCIIMQNVCIQNSSEIGNGVILNPGVEIHHESFVDDYSLIYTNSVIRTQVKVGKRVRIGSTVSVGNNTIILDDSDIPNGMAL